MPLLSTGMLSGSIILQHCVHLSHFFSNKHLLNSLKPLYSQKVASKILGWIYHSQNFHYPLYFIQTSKMSECGKHSKPHLLAASLASHAFRSKPAIPIIKEPSFWIGPWPETYKNLSTTKMAINPGRFWAGGKTKGHIFLNFLPLVELVIIYFF